MTDPKIKVSEDGPYLVSGNVLLEREESVPNEDNIPEKWRKKGKIATDEKYHLCRCGRTKSAPFCDGSHEATPFDGTETAVHTKYDDRAELNEGPDLNLKDDETLCAGARFCDLGDRVWNLVDESDDPDAKKLAIQEACNCPAGRLVAIDKKTGKAIEPKFDPSISVVEDLGAKVSGPLWVKGGVSIESANGEEYEKRNRVTLCRCGHSENKPFCDATHIGISFKDKTEE